MACSALSVSCSTKHHKKNKFKCGEVEKKPSSNRNPVMATASTLVPVTVAALFILIASISTVDAGGDQQFSWMPVKPATCTGSIAECMAAGDEFDMDSEINRRILATTKYISYGALQRNNIPCSQRGASYYNCKPGAQANPYTRGCSAITRCRS